MHLIHKCLEPKLAILQLRVGIESIQLGTVANSSIRQFVATFGQTFRLETGAVKFFFQIVRWCVAMGSAQILLIDIFKLQLVCVYVRTTRIQRKLDADVFQYIFCSPSENKQTKSNK